MKIKKIIFIVFFTFLGFIHSIYAQEKTNNKKVSQITKERNPGSAAVVSCQLPEFKAFIDKVKKGQPVVIAYLGGSITQGAITWPARGTDVSGAAYDYSSYNSETASWRGLTFEWLRSRFEKTPNQFKQVNAAIGGTPGLLGAYRLDQDILSAHPDLVFVEFAVNDAGSAKLTRENPEAPQSILRTYKSIIDRLRAQNPHVAIFMPLSTHRNWEGSALNPWGKILDMGHDQTRLAAEMLHVPYVSLKEAFYANPKNPDAVRYYIGSDDAGNYVHPAPFGHQAYAVAVEKTLSDIFKTGTFSFGQAVKPVSPYPVNPQLIFPEKLLPHASGWKIETLPNAEVPILNGHSCLVTGSANNLLEYTFRGSGIGLWFDIQSKGGMEIYLDGEKLGLYGQGLKEKVKFSGRFCSLAVSLNSSVPHTLRLVPVSMPEVPAPRILLRALTIDGFTGSNY